jgi:hypothetical protein
VLTEVEYEALTMIELEGRAAFDERRCFRERPRPALQHDARKAAPKPQPGSGAGMPPANAQRVPLR